MVFVDNETIPKVLVKLLSIDNIMGDCKSYNKSNSRVENKILEARTLLTVWRTYFE